MTSGPQDPQHGGWGPPPGQGPEGQGSPGQGQPPYGQGQQGGWGPPPGQGQQGGWGGPGQGGQPQYGQYGGYPAAPGGWESGPPEEPQPRPSTVRFGLGAFLASTLINLISLVLGFSDLDEVRRQAATDSGLTEEQVDALVNTTIVITLVLIAAFLLVIWFAWQGHNWARIVLFVLGGISVLLGLLGAGVGLSFLGLVQLVLVAAGIVLLAQKQSNEWYRSERRRRALR
ncbi:hypothetical protein JD78_03149 [Modestobacter roseus]|uniref:Uncharacterized protein n=1 Tax=Modestobacter roseus TaxID=1181884 RepID=A0A562IVA3_9ACTN|nr:hypothetical protein [Modestobacter roseus]TWH74605.1 hypothetical protein JD78_03149 [Modestobacter roseus]